MSCSDSDHRTIDSDYKCICNEGYYDESGSHEC